MTVLASSVDIEIQPDTNPAEPKTSGNRWIKQLPNLLRSFGTIVILFSLYNFLMRGWDGGSDLTRYLMLLGHTGLLAVIGLSSGHFLKEGKGARLLLILALISVTVNFAILGAFLYSTTMTVDVAAYPGPVAWTVDSFFIASSTAIGALFILLPIVLIGFRTLARGMSGRISFLFILSNLLLLVPLRDPTMVTLLTLILGCYTLFVSARMARQRTEAKTNEGIIALLLQFLPVAVLLGRSVWLYTPDMMLFTSAALMIFIAFRQSTLFLPEASKRQKVIQSLCVCLALATGVGTFDILLAIDISASLSMILSTLLSASMVYQITNGNAQNAANYRTIAVFITTAGLITNLILHGNIEASVICLLAGMITIVQSYIVQQRSIFTSGSILTLTGLADQFIHIFQTFDFGYWAVLTVLGIAAIILGSVLESKGSDLKLKITQMKSRYLEWGY
jgi:hypothetical protein